MYLSCCSFNYFHLEGYFIFITLLLITIYTNTHTRSYIYLCDMLKFFFLEICVQKESFQLGSFNIKDSKIV